MNDFLSTLRQTAQTAQAMQRDVNAIVGTQPTYQEERDAAQAELARLCADLRALIAQLRMIEENPAYSGPVRATHASIIMRLRAILDPEQEAQP